MKLRFFAVLICSVAFLRFSVHSADQNSSSQSLEAASASGKRIFQSSDGKYEFSIDATETPDLIGWSQKELAPAVQEWYPKIVQLLPSDGFQAPDKFSIIFKQDLKGVAGTSDTRIECAADWFRHNLQGEALGAVMHELVHVVQQYGRARRSHSDATRAPGWLVEGIADYIRWYHFEPQSHGTEVVLHNPGRARFDAGYRATARFLDWAILKYDKSLIQQLNAAAREGKYDDQLWKQYTGSTVQELGDEWKKSLETKVAALGGSPDELSANQLTDEQKNEGWKLLFDGKDFEGWSNFKTNTVRVGWQIKDGTLACVDPQHAGDLCTKEQFGSFELQLDYNISEGGNSGIMYHVTDQGRAAWATGPEFQLEDNKAARDPIRCGWLYALYQPPDDPETGKPLDATKAAGQWNHVRLLITPQKCEHEINGVKYFDYVIGSEDFNQRVAKSKFAEMPFFAKSHEGYISLQGDHGQVAFRNIMIRSR